MSIQPDRLEKIERKKDSLIKKIKGKTSIWSSKQCCYSHWKKFCIDFVCKRCNRRIHSSIMSIKGLKELLLSGCDCTKKRGGL